MILLKVENMSEHKSSALVDQQMDRALLSVAFH